MHFSSARARHQVERILAYVGAPGLACVLDQDGCVIAALGEVAGCDAEAIAQAFGAHRDALIVPGGALESCGHASYVVPLRASLFLCAIVPSAIASSAPMRIERARALLDRMLATGDGAVGPAHAEVSAVPPRAFVS